jgi:outer membrane protein
MNRNSAIALLGACLLVGGVVSADAAGPTVQLKIGFVDLQKTLNETAAGKKAKAKLESDKKAKQTELDKKQKELQAYAAELEKQKVVLKPDVLRQREKELQDKYVALQERYFQLQQDLSKQEALLVREIFGKASPIIDQIAKRDGYTLILEKNEGAVLYGDKNLDLTPEVNKRLQ